MADSRHRAAASVLIVLALLALASIVLFMTFGVRGRWDFVLPFRGAKVAAMIIVGHAIALSTVLFQTITHNRILTPSIMGFDNLYVLIQTGLIVFIGSAATSALPPEARFVLEAIVMTAFAGLLFVFLFSGAVRSIHLLVLVGIVLGTLFRSLSNFLQRLLDPDAFAVLQDSLFASFNSVDTALLGVASAVILGVTVAAWRILPLCDVLSLGREAAVGLGVDHRRSVFAILIMVAVLVSVSTALVGPVIFFGLLVANLAYLVVPSYRHRLIVPAASLIAVTSLVGGQFVLQHVFAFDTALSIIIEFVGGIVFIFMLVRGIAR